MYVKSGSLFSLDDDDEEVDECSHQGQGDQRH
jgi:hypothetical protein